MKLLIPLLLLFFYAPAQADIYKGTDAEGQTTYSDEAHPDSKLIPTPSPNTIQMQKPVAAKPVKEKEVTEVTTKYTLFNIVSPTNGETLRSNTGDISVVISLEPALDKEKGHRIIIYLDDQAVLSTATESNIQLANVGRGQHSLRAEVRSSKGKRIISSASVIIHMKRLSGQHQKPTGTPPEPLDPEGKPYKPGPQETYFVPGPIPPPPEIP